MGGCQLLPIHLHLVQVPLDPPPSRRHQNATAQLYGIGWAYLSKSQGLRKSGHTSGPDTVGPSWECKIRGYSVLTHHANHANHTYHARIYIPSPPCNITTDTAPITPTKRTIHTRQTTPTTPSKYTMHTRHCAQHMQPKLLIHHMDCGTPRERRIGHAAHCRWGTSTPRDPAEAAPTNRRNQRQGMTGS